MAIRLVFPPSPAPSSFSCTRSGHHHRVWCSASPPTSPATVVKTGAVDWKKATSHFFDSDTRPIMLFDGVCNLCNGGVKFVRDNDQNRSYIKSEAVLKIMEYLDLPFSNWLFFVKLIPLFMRDTVYDTVANNRYLIFGRSDACEI
ncbi:unnamed protein product [Victoria cruziana]